MRVVVRQRERGRFVGESGSGATLRMEASPELGGVGDAFRPMETVLAALAGCSGIDVQMILEQQKEPLEGLTIEVDGTRSESTPRVFTSIAVRFTVHGPVSPHKAARAVQLSMEKYCSVSRMLAPGVVITHDVVVDG